MSNNAIQFDQATGKFFFIAPNGKKTSSPDVGYVAYRYAKVFEQQFRNAGNVSFEVNGEQTHAATVDEFDINQRFEFIVDYVNMIASGIQPSMIITGPGGLGKSFTVHEAMINAGFVDCTNMESFKEGDILPVNRFRVIKGYSTAKSLYRTLYENENSILIFDDCDSILKDPNAINVLKGALDTNEERIICWNAEAAFGDDLPRSFRFEGGVIFISNQDKEKIPQALRSRSVCVDVSMTTDQKLQRMSKIISLPSFMPNVDTEIKEMALEAITKYKNIANDVSLRSLVQIVRIGMLHKGEKFENLTKYALTN